MAESLETKCRTSGAVSAHVGSRVPFYISGLGRSHLEGDIGAEAGRTQRAAYRLGKAVQRATATAAAALGKSHAQDIGKGARRPGGRATAGECSHSYSSVSALGKGGYR